MCEDPIQSTKDVDQMPHARLRTTARLRTQRQPTREVFGRCQNIRSPIQRVTAVIDSAAGFRGIMDGAEILPFRGLHFRTRLSRARRVFEKESHDQIIDFHGKEAAEFVEPQGPVNALRGFRKLDSDIAVDRGNGIGVFGSGEMVM